MLGVAEKWGASQCGFDIKIASIQQTSKPIIAALVKQRCSAGVRKSL